MSYALTQKNSGIIEKYFNAFDLELISDIKEKDKCLKLLNEILLLLSDNEIIDNFNMNNARKLVYADCNYVSNDVNELFVN